MDDNSIMPFGKHKGKILKDVPDEYLLYIYEEDIAKGDLKEYIIDNLNAIKHNLKK